MALWRVSFDNLNYKMKYAKKLTTAGPKKMLNLITSQVCFRDIKSGVLSGTLFVYFVYIKALSIII